MESTTAKFDKGKNAVLVENNAQTIFDHLNELEKDSKIYSKRWFWELLQNAKDSVNNNSKVSVKVVLNNEKLSFLHTGDAFEENDILHLIFHGSSKKSIEGKTGRFGTGFMSTHLLSRKVNITGKLADQTYFKFDLNREAINVPQQQENLETSYELFCKSNESEKYTDENYETVFTYELSEPSLKIAQEGIKQLQRILPFVMAFNEKIEDIEVIDNKETFSIRRGEKKDEVIDEKRIISQEIIYNENTYYVVFAKSEDFDIAVLLEKKEQTLNLVHLDDSYPKLFFDFPLFGTEKFGCPVVINSTKFDLKGERDGLYLGAEDNDKPTIKENKRIVAASLDFLGTLIKYLSQQQTVALFNLFKLTSPFEYNWLDNEWLKSIYISKIDVLLEAECLKVKESFLKLKNIAVPYSKTSDPKSFYNIVTEFIHGSSPQIVEADDWIMVADGFSKLEKKEIIGYDFVINENKLCRIIEEKGTLNEINEALEDKPSDEIESFTTALSWLNKLFNLLSKDQIEYLSSHYSIIPNQKKNLVKKELTTPFIDKIGDEKIKGVTEEFGWDIRSDLIYPGLNFKEGVFQSFSLEKALTYISTSADKIKDEQLTDIKTRKALISNVKWLIDNKNSTLLKDAFVVVEKGRESNEVNYSKRRLFQTNADKLLASSSNWVDSFSIYKDIVLKKFILIDEYMNQLTTDDFVYMESEGLIFISPLIFKSNPSKNDLKLLVKKPEDYSKLLNEKEEVIENNIEYSDIAYLTRSDDNILSKTADSLRSAKSLLKFLLTQVLVKDIFFNQPSEVIVASETIQLSKCLWVSRLKETQWIPVKSGEGEKQNNSERPSVANITELIKDEPDIINNIKTKNAALFFNYLGISVADIIRNSLTNEDEKLKWDMTFSQLITNGNINPELASEMLSDPNLQDVYLKQKKEREQIKKNQDIGYLFEKIFREIFESNEYQGQGFSINRTAIGSDFGISYSHDLVIKDQDILDEEGQEVFFQIDKVFIELKATRKKFAEMTPRQAETATKNINNYVLAVLPLNNYELNEETITRYSKFVVNIAEPLIDRYNDFKSYSDMKVEATQEKADVRLNIEDGNIRYQVKSEIWENSTALEFDEFINWLKLERKK